MDLLQTISTFAGLISFVIVGIIAIFVVKSGIGKSANEAQASAIDALQAEVATLRGRVADTEKENIRLEHTIETMCAALQTKGLIITIQGEMINIQEGKSVTTTRIRGKIHTIEDDT